MTQGSWPIRTLLVLQLKESCPFPAKDRHSCGVGQLPFDTHALSRDKRVLIEHETRKDTPTQGDKPSTGCVGPLSLGRKCFRPKAHSDAAELGPKDCMHETALPNMYKTKPTLSVVPPRDAVRNGRLGQGQLL